VVGKGEDQHEIHSNPIHNQITSAPAEKKAGKAQTCTKLNVNAHTHTHTHTKHTNTNTPNTHTHTNTAFPCICEAQGLARSSKKN